MGWADVTTKHDLSELDKRIDLRFESLEHRLVARFEGALRAYFVASLSAFAVLLTLATAISQLLG